MALVSRKPSGWYWRMVSRYSTIASSASHSGFSGSLRLAALYTPLASAPARPISVSDVQVPETHVSSGAHPAAAALVRASGQASSVPPLKKAVAPLAARLVIWAPTSLAPVEYFSTATTSALSPPSMAARSLSS